MSLQTPSAQRYYMHVLNIQLYTHALNGKEPSLPTCTIHQPWKMQTIQEKVKAFALNIIRSEGAVPTISDFQTYLKSWGKIDPPENKKPCKHLTYRDFLLGCPVGLEPTTFRTTI